MNTDSQASALARAAAVARPAVVLLLLLSLLTGIVYPLAVTAIARLAFARAAAGGVLLRNGTAVGATLIGQPFSDPKHFWGRPSATTPQPRVPCGTRRLRGLGDRSPNAGHKRVTRERFVLLR